MNRLLLTTRGPREKKRLDTPGLVSPFLHRSALSTMNTYGICRAPWPPEQLAPVQWDRSCSICPWVYLHRRWSLQPAVEVVEAEPANLEGAQVAPCLGRRATTFYREQINHSFAGSVWSESCLLQICHYTSSTRVPRRNLLRMCKRTRIISRITAATIGSRQVCILLIGCPHSPVQ